MIAFDRVLDGTFDGGLLFASVDKRIGYLLVFRSFTFSQNPFVLIVPPLHRPYSYINVLAVTTLSEQLLHFRVLKHRIDDLYVKLALLEGLVFVGQELYKHSNEFINFITYFLAFVFALAVDI